MTTSCTFPVLCDVCVHCDEIREIDWQSLDKRSLGEGPVRQERKLEIFSQLNAGRDRIASKLSTEIVSQIFEAYVTMHNFPSDYHPFSNLQKVVPELHFSTSHRSASLRLGAVCRQWRYIAWSDPLLWTTLHVILTIPGHYHGPELVSQWLKRSGSLPLAIRIQNDRTLRLPNKGAMKKESCWDSAQAVVCAINDVAWRLRSLDVADPELATKFVDSKEYPSSLRHFSGPSNTPERFNENTLGLDSVFKNQCHITHLSMRTSMVYIPNNDITFRWNHLTSLTLIDPCVDGIHEFLKYISQSAPLTHLSLYSIKHSRGHDFQASIIELPNLVSLSISASLPQFIKRVFDFLVVPALRSLSYTYNEDDAWDPSVFILSLIARSGCAIEDLILVWFLVPVYSLCTILRSLSAIRNLVICMDDIHDITSFFQCLSQSRLRKDDAPFLPLLARLHITASVPMPWSSFVEIYADYAPAGNKFLTSETPPDRKALQIHFSIMNTLGYIDWDSLVVLTGLCDRHGVVCVFEKIYHDGINMPFLEQSYHSNLPDTTLRNKDDILKSVRMMTSLSLNL